MIDVNNVLTSEIKNLEILAKQVVEGVITGKHKSPFHGFSVEFSEHKLYNKGESTKNIDWKLFAKTEKLYVKKYEEETNLRCHLIIDNSASMHYPIVKRQHLDNLNKIGFSAVASAVLVELFRQQRDAVGMSVYGDSYEYYAPEKGSERHRKMLLNQLDALLTQNSVTSGTETYKYLHEIAEKLHRRSLIFVFTDMFQTTKDEESLFDALRHLKHNKHEVVLFHTYDGVREFDLDFDNRPKKFVDVETNEEINLFSENVKESYSKMMSAYFTKLKDRCLQYKIDYVPVDINAGYGQIISTYLVNRRNFR